MGNQPTENNDTMNALVHYYEARVLALSEYSGLVWNRFNWFVTLQVAIFGFYFAQFGKTTSQYLLEYGAPFVGMTIALIWTVMGAEDRKSQTKHGKITKDIESRIRESLNFKPLEQGSSYFRQTRLLVLFPCLVLGAWMVIVVAK